jgi:hypothetical protein
MAKLVARETDTSTFQVFLLNTQTIDTEVTELPCNISNMGTNTLILNMGTNTDNETIDSICDTIPVSPIHQSFHVFGVLLLIKPEPCSVHASILKGWVCRVFI